MDGVWISRVPDRLSAEACEWLSSDFHPSEHARASNYRAERARASYVVGRWLLRSVLAEQTGKPPSEVVIVYDDEGRPLLPGAQAGDSPYLSITYAHGLVACALSSDEVIGIDAEDMDRKVDHLLIARRFFSPDEHREIAELDGVAQRRCFFRYWVAKEAVLKALGLGLKGGLDRVHLETGPPGRDTCAVYRTSAGAQHLHLDEWRLAGGHLLICARPLREEGSESIAPVWREPTGVFPSGAQPPPRRLDAHSIP